MTERTIEFWFDFASTYSYPTAVRLSEHAEQAHVCVRWRAMLLGPIFQQQGWNDSPFNIYPAKGRYMWHDLQRLCRAHNIPFQRPSEFPRNGLLAARIVSAFDEAAWIGRFVREVFSANFRDDKNIADNAVIADCLARLGLDADSTINEAQTEQSKQKLRARTEQASELGIFGAPSFIANGELFWGNEHLDALLKTPES